MRILAGATTALRRIVDLSLVILVLVVLLGVVLGKGAPVVGRQSIVIGGGSMEPTIGLGAAIVVRPVAAADLAVGDIVSMQVGPASTTFTHRIVAVVDRPDGRWIRTKGDANAEPDPTLVAASEVIGRVELTIPLAGYLLAVLSLPMGVMFVIGLAATLLAIAWLLESLEPEPGPARRTAGTGTGALGSIEPAPHALTSTVPPDRAAIDPVLMSGEPIAARPAAPAAPARSGPPPASPSSGKPAGGSPGRGSTNRGTGSRRTFPASLFAPSVSVPGAASVARPTVRVQLERSREVRQQRARWLMGHGPDRRAVD
jgi:signal peptidase